MLQQLLSSVIMMSFLVQITFIGLAAITGSVGLADVSKCKSFFRIKIVTHLSRRFNKIQPCINYMQI